MDNNSQRFILTTERSLRIHDHANQEFVFKRTTQDEAAVFIVCLVRSNWYMCMELWRILPCAFFMWQFCAVSVTYYFACVILSLYACFLAHIFFFFYLITSIHFPFHVSCVIMNAWKCSLVMTGFILCRSSFFLMLFSFFSATFFKLSRCILWRVNVRAFRSAF